MSDDIKDTLARLKKDAEEGYARYQEGFGPRIMLLSCLDALPLVVEFERLEAENKRLRAALTGLATNCSAENIRLALQILGLPV